MLRANTCFRSAFVAALLVTSVATANADSTETDRVTAETLFVEAKKLMDAGKYAQACPKFADSQKLDPGVGTLLNLARCYEKQGKMASAWSTYREASSAARSKGQADRESLARQSAAALEPRLTRVTVTLPSAVTSLDGLVVTLDGGTMPRSLWGVPAPVDAGDHTLDVVAKGRKRWSGHFTVAPPANPTVVVPDLEPAPVDADSKDVGLIVGTNAPSGPNAQRPIAIGLGVVGLAGLAAGAAFAFSAKSTYGDSDAQCRANNVCTPAGRSLRDTAFSKAAASTVAFGVGGAALVAGVVVWITAPPRRVDAAPTVGFFIAPPGEGNPATLDLRGSW